MKTIRVELSRKLKKIKIVTLADLHLGDVNCKLDEFKEKISYIKDNDDTFCILNGDLMNNATKQSVSDVYSEQLKPSEQLRLLSELLEPIKDKILCITGGNHEFRTFKQDGIDITEILSRELGISERYSSASALIYVTFGSRVRDHSRPMCYSIFVNHGCGGGRKIGGKLNKLEDLVSIIDADIYIHSHTHLPAIFKQNYYRTSFTAKTVDEVEKLFVNTNAFLEYGGYGETYEFRPASRSVPIIYLSGEKRIMEAKI